MTTIRLSTMFVAFAMVGAACGDGPPCEPTSGTICTVVGNGSAGLSAEGQARWATRLYLPMDMRINPTDGRLFISDFNNHRLRVVDEDDEVTTIAGDGRLGDGPEGPALVASFNHPTDFVFNETGQIVLAAWHNSRINVIDVDSGDMSFYCGTGMRNYNGNEGPRGSAVIDLPSGLAWAPNGDLVFVDQGNQVIRRIDASGNIHLVAGQCVTGICEEGVDPMVCPTSNKTTCSMAADACTMAPCEAGFAGDGGPASEARFSFPTGQAADPSGRLVVDDAGNIYIADTGNNRIRRIGTDGVITTVVGNGVAGFSGDGGPATEAEIDTPIDIDIGPDGDLYFADKENSCVRAVDPAGTIRTVAGVCGERGFSGDGGDPTHALLDRPYGIELDDEGNLYIADTHNHVIRVVTP